jgi:hypothetical protein
MELTTNQMEIVSIGTISQLIIRPLSLPSKKDTTLVTSQLALKNLNRAKKNNYGSN